MARARREWTKAYKELTAKGANTTEILSQPKYEKYREIIIGSLSPKEREDLMFRVNREAEFQSFIDVVLSDSKSKNEILNDLLYEKLLTKTMFFPYCHKDRNIADMVYEDLDAILPNNIIRDENCLVALDSIREFTKRVKKEDYVCVVVTNAFLRSRYCMLEVLKLLERDDYKKRTIPYIVAEIYEPLGQVKFIKYWKDQRERYVREVQTLPPGTSAEAQDRIKEITIIGLRIGEFLHWLADSISLRIDNFAEEVREKILKDLAEEGLDLLPDNIAADTTEVPDWIFQ